MVITLKEAQEAVPQEVIDLTRQSVRSGFRVYFEDYPVSLRIAHSARSRACLINDHVLDHVRRSFGEVRGARLVNVRGRYFLAYENAVASFLGSFKKVDDAKRTKNIPTRQAIAFVTQRPLLDIPEATNLVLGYQLNRFATDLQATYIICPDGNKVAWSWQIDGLRQVDLLDGYEDDGASATGTGPQGPQPVRPSSGRVRLKGDVVRPAADAQAAD